MGPVFAESCCLLPIAIAFVCHCQCQPVDKGQSGKVVCVHVFTKIWGIWKMSEPKIRKDGIWSLFPLIGSLHLLVAVTFSELCVTSSYSQQVGSCNSTLSVDQFCSTWQFCLSCGSKLLHMTINFRPHDKIACHVEQFYHVKQLEIALHLLFGSIHIQNCSTWQIYNVNGLFMIYAVLT